MMEMGEVVEEKASEGILGDRLAFVNDLHDGTV
jgi:hypothetical protein